MAAMGRVIVCLLVLLPAIVASAKAEGDVKCRANLAAEDVELKTLQDDAKTSESWADWASDNIFEGLGYRHENAKEIAWRMMESAKEKIGQAISGLMNSTEEKAEEKKDGVKEQDVNVKQTLDEGSDNAADAAARAYEDAKREAEQRAHAAGKQQAGEDQEFTTKNAIGDNAKYNYEQAKEKLSGATGEVGEYMQEEL